MTDRFRVTLAQLNPTVGDLAGNAEKALRAWREGRDAGADLVALPEMFLTGYQIQDMTLRGALLLDAERALFDLAADCADGPALGVGLPMVDGDVVHNCYVVCSGGEVAARVRKHRRPNTQVFDEVRVYASGDVAGPVRIGPLRLGIPICEDAWSGDVCETLAESGAEALLVPNGSPYSRGKLELRHQIMVARVVETGLPLVYLNLVSGQDDQVFDGGSFALNPGGGLALQMPPLEEELRHVDLSRGAEGWRVEEGSKAAVSGEWETDYRVMVFSVAEYFRKTGFGRALLGLSGGIDSALVAAIAADALGPENVRCVMLPSRHTSRASLDDAAACAKALGARLDTIPITGPQDAVTAALSSHFEGREPDVTEENIQSRLRGLLLMALSNKFGEMLLTTGNKSEAAVGYATIYGDMSGGYNPLKDLYKTRVFETCRWRNANHRSWMKGPAGEAIPAAIIEKPPTAELRDNQKDEDSLPPYAELDAILEMLVDRAAGVDEVVALGHDRETVKKIEQLIYISEYKRFQSAPGTRLTPTAFWLDRRYPIANRWRDKS